MYVNFYLSHHGCFFWWLIFRVTRWSVCCRCCLTQLFNIRELELADGAWILYSVVSWYVIVLCVMMSLWIFIWWVLIIFSTEEMYDRVFHADNEIKRLFSGRDMDHQIICIIYIWRACVVCAIQTFLIF